MMLRELTSETNEDGSRIVRVRARVSDHADRDEQPEWIEFQVAVDWPTSHSGASLRREVLEKASVTLDKLARDFGRLAAQAGK